MNMLQKLDVLEHPEACGIDILGVCRCGLDEVRTATRELVRAATVAVDGCPGTDPLTDRLLSRLFAALQPFRDAQDNAR